MVMETLTPPGLPKTAQQTLEQLKRSCYISACVGSPVLHQKGGQEATSLSVAGLKPLLFADLLQSIYFWP